MESNVWGSVICDVCKKKAVRYRRCAKCQVHICDKCGQDTCPVCERGTLLDPR
jgi:hypothetical protein